jgi:hypothetical protein
MDTYTAAAATTAGKTSQERDREAVAAAGRVLPPIVHRMLGFKDTGLSNSPPDATLPRLFRAAKTCTCTADDYTFIATTASAVVLTVTATDDCLTTATEIVNYEAVEHLASAFACAHTHCCAATVMTCTVQVIVLMATPLLQRQ